MFWIAATNQKIYYFMIKVISMEENTQPQLFTLDDTTEDDIILTMLCGKKIFSIMLQEF